MLANVKRRPVTSIVEHATMFRTLTLVPINMETFTVKNFAIRTWLGDMEANLLRHSLESKLIEHKICDKMRGGGGCYNKKTKDILRFSLRHDLLCCCSVAPPPPQNFRRDVTCKKKWVNIPKKH